MKLRKKRIKTPAKRAAVVRISPWFNPHIKRGKRYVPALPKITKAKCGVYIIRSKATKKILYVGHSGSQLQKTLYNHFRKWNDRQYRATYENKGAYQVMVILHPACQLAFMLEQYFLHRLSPRDGKRKLEVPLEEIDFTYMPRPQMIKEEIAPF